MDTQEVKLSSPVHFRFIPKCHPKAEYHKYFVDSVGGGNKSAIVSQAWLLSRGPFPTTYCHHLGDVCECGHYLFVLGETAEPVGSWKLTTTAEHGERLRSKYTEAEQANNKERSRLN